MNKEHKNIGSFLAFSPQWFEKNQTLLLKLLNWKLTKRLFRWILRITKDDVGHDATIVKIEPNSYTVVKRFLRENVELITDFRTHPKFGKRLYYAFKPMWWVMHIWDEVFADRYAPQLSFGFSILTSYPGSIGTDNPVDGAVTSSLSGQGWAAVRDATSGSALYTSQTTDFATSKFYSGTIYEVTRGFFLFDTSSLGATVSISATTLSLCANAGGVLNTNSTDIRIVSSSPAGTTSLVDEDYDQCGSTSYVSMNFSSWTDTDGTYNDFTLDSNGIVNVNKTGISKFGVRCGRDLDNSAPTGNNGVSGYYSNVAGTTKDPKLVVTYTIPDPDLNLTDQFTLSESVSLLRETPINININDQLILVDTVAPVNIENSIFMPKSGKGIVVF